MLSLYTIVYKSITESRRKNKTMLIMAESFEEALSIAEKKFGDSLLEVKYEVQKN